MTRLLCATTFSATHQIYIAGVLEPVHGHDFLVQAEVKTADERDAATLLPALEATLGPLQGTHLEAVERALGGCPSAERIAAWLHGRLSERLAGDSGLGVSALTVHEAPGCAATYRSA